MPSLLIVVLLTSAFVILGAIITVLVYVAVRYSPIVARIFEEKPLFFPLRVASSADGEDVRFATSDGLKLAGTYLKTRTSTRSGVLVFCHEYLSNRWSVLPYLDHLRDHGFDILTFDFRNHGESEHDAKYTPLQWVTDHEARDLRAAISYLRSRPDADPAGYGLFGVSRGGGTALVGAAADRGAWGVVTDGAFSTRGTMVAYIHRWAHIYIRMPWLWTILPNASFEYLAWTGRIRTQLRLGCRYSNIEHAVRRLAPRPWLAIHGQKDAYIGVEIAQGLFELAGSPKELWIVPMAKHNRCREREPVAYASRVLDFFQTYAPRRLQSIAEPLASPQSTPYVTSSPGNELINSTPIPATPALQLVMPE